MSGGDFSLEGEGPKAATCLLRAFRLSLTKAPKELRSGRLRAPANPVAIAFAFLLIPCRWKLLPEIFLRILCAKNNA